MQNVSLHISATAEETCGLTDHVEGAFKLASKHVRYIRNMMNRDSQTAALHLQNEVKVFKWYICIIQGEFTRTEILEFVLKVVKRYDVATEY